MPATELFRNIANQTEETEFYTPSDPSMQTKAGGDTT